MHSHASIPIALHLQADYYRIYFSTRDKQGRANTGFIVIDIKQPCKILEISTDPVLAPGKLGAFDDSGAMASTILHKGEQCYWMYYIGWNTGITVPFRNSIGLAISTDGGRTFKRFADGPIADRTPREPYFVGTACVRKEDFLYRMWYQSCIGWKETVGTDKPKYFCNLKYAESADGINWRRQAHVAIDQVKDEYAISCARVIYEDGAYKMWFSCRSDHHDSIGYAESHDGVSWHRTDEQGLRPSGSFGFDSKSVCYPYIFDHDGQRFMLYNGNDFTKTGFGLAVLE